MSDEGKPEEYEEEEGPDFERKAQLAYRTTVTLLLRAHKRNDLWPAINGLIAGLVEIMWRLRTDEKTRDDLMGVLEKLVGGYLDQAVSHPELDPPKENEAIH